MNFQGVGRVPCPISLFIPLPLTESVTLKRFHVC